MELPEIKPRASGVSYQCSTTTELRLTDNWRTTTTKQPSPCKQPPPNLSLFRLLLRIRPVDCISFNLVHMHWQLITSHSSNHGDGLLMIFNDTVAVIRTTLMLPRWVIMYLSESESVYILTSCIAPSYSSPVESPPTMSSPSSLSRMEDPSRDLQGGRKKH